MLTCTHRGAQYCYIWAGSNFLCVAFFYLFMPEMKGRTLEELDEMFQNRVGVKQFRTYQCTVKEDARQDVKVNAGLLDERSGKGPDVVEMEDADAKKDTGV